MHISHCEDEIIDDNWYVGLMYLYFLSGHSSYKTPASDFSV